MALDMHEMNYLAVLGGLQLALLLAMAAHLPEYPKYEVAKKKLPFACSLA